MMLVLSYAVALWAAVLGVLVALYVFATRQEARLASPLWRPLFIIVIVWVVSLVALPGTAINPLVGLVGGLGVFATVKGLRVDPSRLLWWLGVIVAGVVVAESVITGGRPGAWANSNELASIILLLLPYTSRHSLPVLLTALVATQSRAALVGVMVMGALWIAHHQLHTRQRRLWFGVAVVAGMVVAASLALWRLDTISERLVSYGEALELWSHAPFWGWGIGSWRNIPHAAFAPTHADSLPLTLLAETGLIGVVAFVPLVRAISADMRLSQWLGRWVLVAVAAQNIVDAPLYFPASCLLLGVALALVEAGVPRPVAEPAPVVLDGGWPYANTH